MSSITRLGAKKSFSLICEPHVTAVWKAVQVMTQGRSWIYIEDIGRFLRARQAEHRKTGSATCLPYLKPTDVGDLTGWSDASIAHALSTANKRGVLHLRTESEGHYFKSVPYTDQYPWRVADAACPSHEAWNTLYQSLPEENS